MGAIDAIPDTPVFDEEERQSLEQDPVLSPFAAITRNQLFGLLVALGEYAVRTDPEATPYFLKMSRIRNGLRRTAPS